PDVPRGVRCSPEQVPRPPRRTHLSTNPSGADLCLDSIPRPGTGFSRYAALPPARRGTSSAVPVPIDSDIDAQIELPEECVAPIIFIIAGSEEKWFAVTGFSSE